MSALSEFEEEFGEWADVFTPIQERERPRMTTRKIVQVIGNEKLKSSDCGTSVQAPEGMFDFV